MMESYSGRDRDIDKEWDDEEEWDEDEESETIPCPDCGSMIYEDSEVCPVCGSYVVFGKESVKRPIWMAVVALLLIACMLLLLFPYFF